MEEDVYLRHDQQECVAYGICTERGLYTFGNMARNDVKACTHMRHEAERIMITCL